MLDGENLRDWRHDIIITNDYQHERVYLAYNFKEVCLSVYMEEENKDVPDPPR